VCGGYSVIRTRNRHFAYEKRCYEYKKTTGSWEPFPSMTTKRDYFDMKFLNQAVWAIGGLGGSESTTTLDKYEIHSNVWTKHTIPFDVCGHCLTKISEHELILIGGRRSEESGKVKVSAKTRIFDTRTNTWTQGPNMKTGRYFHGCFSIEEKGVTTKVVAMGGVHSGYNWLATAEILDVASMQWQDLPDLPFEVHGNKGIESVIGPDLGFSVAGQSNAGYENRIIGLRKNRNGTYFWQELTTQLTSGRYLPAVVNDPDSMVPSC